MLLRHYHKINFYMNDTMQPVLFEDTGENEPRADAQWIERNAITAVVYDPKTDRILGLRWDNDVKWETLVTGGIEEGQSPEDACRTEILQETGYGNIELVSELPPYDSKFYHHGKKVNRYAHFKCFLFKLVDDEKKDVDDAELKIHEPVWLTREEMKAFRLPEGHRYVMDAAWNVIG